MVVLTAEKERMIEKNTYQLEQTLRNMGELRLEKINKLSEDLLRAFNELQCDIYSIPEVENREKHLQKSYEIANSILSKIERNIEADQISLFIFSNS